MKLEDINSRNWITLISILCLGILVNCVSFVKYENPNLKNTAIPEILEKKTILIKYFGDYYENGKIAKFPQAIPTLNEKMEGILKDSNLFKNVTTNDKESVDLIMIVETNMDDKSSKILAGVSGATFLVFPLFINLELNMKVSLLDSNYKLLAINEERYANNSILGWIVLPISPFFFTPIVETRAYRNVIYSSLNNWKAKGIIK
ncbi:hypothetical protein LEP1GSC202_1711 [Leptospira yanagawae serovar Saopaulo str. Sao Paulo = ATCC 700523]|uniref:Uncharacterized protein n=1 Tax=Leptospira yanagawae serovar Saopaulo str. Sao Paulo = ATCC 700523 TaxID=1249483 RepID=A0A5E8HEW8_9LEPT|nr:hypothetical protein [Leptospira yanagawae]EOQ89825.1 hypothetical protein LEP1GSC202_1711 [Leptospira yanagawae serovar Saopaulo str. Sao Paulo = ATCC 700523]